MLTVSKRRSNLKLFIKKLSSRIESLRGFDDDNDTTLNESTLVSGVGPFRIEDEFLCFAVDGFITIECYSYKCSSCACLQS